MRASRKATMVFYAVMLGCCIALGVALNVGPSPSPLAQKITKALQTWVK